jgi:hypothetical protein
LFAALDRQYLALYAWSEITLDLVFPFLYGPLTAMLIVRLYSPRYAWLLLAPLVSVAADLTENFSIAYLAVMYNHDPGSISATLVSVANTATRTKTVMVYGVSVAIIVFGAIAAVVRRRQSTVISAQSRRRRQLHPASPSDQHDHPATSASYQLLLSGR